MRIRRHLQWLTVLLFSISSTLAAKTPEEVFSSYTAALKERGMAAAPEFIHPDELVRFKAMLLPLFQRGDASNNKDVARNLVGPTATPESVASMEPVEFMRTFLSAVDKQIKELNVNMGEAHVIGSVAEGRVVHLVTRSTTGIGDIEMSRLEVVSLKAYGKTWRLLLSGHLEGMAKMLNAESRK